MRRNKNRGYQNLRVWNDSVDFYTEICSVFRKFPYELKRITSQSVASSDSVHRNIAEGYCRRSIREYLQFLNIALGSLGETVSGNNACLKANQISAEEFEMLDEMAYKIENGLLKLVERLEEKKEKGDWDDSLVVKESNAVYGSE